MYSPCMYVCLSMESLTKLFWCGCGKFIMTLRSLYNLVSMGENHASLPNGFVKKGTIIDQYCRSFLMYSVIFSSLIIASF